MEPPRVESADVCVMRSTDSPSPSRLVRTYAFDGNPAFTASWTVSGVPSRSTVSPGVTLSDEA